MHPIEKIAAYRLKPVNRLAKRVSGIWEENDNKVKKNLKNSGDRLKRKPCL